MLPKKNRLTQKKDFDFVFKNGKTVRSTFLLFKFLKNHISETRFGFIVSKKISNKATKRNLVKRRLRGAVSNLSEDFNSLKNKKSFDIIMIALPGILDKNFSEIEKMITDFLEKQKLHIT